MQRSWRYGWRSEQIDYDWSDVAGRAEQRARIAEHVATWLADLRGTKKIRLDIVWAAGKNGFDSSAEAMAIETVVDENIAKQIAIEIGGSMPIILSARHLLGVAKRWKSQFNENPDTWAAWEAVPEAGHNMIQGILGDNISEGTLYVLALKPDSLSPAVSESIDITLQLLSENHVPNLVLDISAPNPLGEVLSGALMGDMVSYYSAILHERNPSATTNLTEMKSRLDPMSVERS